MLKDIKAPRKYLGTLQALGSKLFYIFETKDYGGSMIRKTLGNIGKALFGC
jgi:hypothetical protein